MRLRVRDQGERLAFAAGAGRRGNGDQRQHRPGGLADAPIVLHPPAIGQQEIAALGRIHAAAAAEADEEVDLLLRARPRRSRQLPRLSDSRRRGRIGRRRGRRRPATLPPVARARRRRSPDRWPTSTRVPPYSRTSSPRRSIAPPAEHDPRSRLEIEDGGNGGRHEVAPPSGRVTVREVSFKGGALHFIAVFSVDNKVQLPRGQGPLFRVLPTAGPVRVFKGLPLPDEVKEESGRGCAFLCRSPVAACHVNSACPACLLDSLTLLWSNRGNERKSVFCR